MKTWQAILLHLALTAGAAAVPTITDPTLQVALGALVAAGTSMAANQNSKTNPDGTPADVAYKGPGR